MKNRTSNIFLQSTREPFGAGFALIEILLVIAIILTIGFFTTVFPLRLIAQMSVNDTRDELKSELKKAQSYALAGRGHSPWGVHYGNSTITLFKGDSYANRDHGFDEEINLDEEITISGFTQAVFTIPSGRPQAAISGITISRNSAESASFSLNAEGALE